MRPIRLVIDGLACFRDRQEIDFSALDLFAISGPTGAGKSTILDAIVLALYGNVPRVDTGDRAQMIAASRDRASVVLEFAAGPDRYRIARTLKRRGASAVGLERIEASGGAVSLGDQVRIVDSKIEEILGLDVEAFKQAVVLPQGEFAAFLQAVPGDRRRMLQSLLRLEVYERMRAQALRVATDRKNAIDTTTGLLDHEYAGVSAEALAGLEVRVAGSGRQLEALRQQRTDAESTLTVVRARHEKSRVLDKAEAAIRSLEARADEMARAGEALARARRAAETLPTIGEAERAAKEAETARVKAAKSAAENQAARVAADAKAAALRDAEAAMAAVPQLRERIETLNRMVGRLPELKRLEGEIARQAKAIAALVAEGTRLGRAIEDATATQKAERAALARAAADASASGYDAAEESLLSGLRGRASALSADRRSLAEATSRLDRDRAALEAARSQAKSLGDAARKSREAADVARRESEAAEARLHAAHRMDAANGLRHSLVAGEACPVCEQTVARPPAAALTPEVEAAARERAVTKERFDSAEAAARQAETAHTRAEAAFAAANAALETGEQGALGLARRIEAQAAALLDALGDRRPESALIVEAWIEERATRLAAARDAHTRAQDERRRAEHAIELAKAAEATSVAALAEKDASRIALESELRSTREQLASLRAEITAVVESGDPATEVARIQASVTSLEATRKRAAEEAAPAGLRLSAAAETERLHAEAAKAAAAAAVERLRIRDAKLSEAGFANPAEATAARLEPSVMKAREDAIDAWERDRHATQARIAELKNDLGEGRVSDAELQAAVRRCDETTAKADAATRQSAELEASAIRMKERLERSIAMRTRLLADEAEHRVYDRLATDLKGDRFQAYVLEEAFSELVQGASTRLLSLTGERYSLLFRDDQILVVDNDNAGETRISDTLSGGETFLASLSLALELSAQVQRAAGAVNLDSLFIDEGFGTLDPETLALVAETIQGLQAGGRMVGIITHIPELRDEFAQQILVTKHEGFSTVAVRAGT